MPRLALSLVAAGAALAIATPAAAQYYPRSHGYGSNGYDNYRPVGSLQSRIDAFQYRIRLFDRRNLIDEGSADRLRDEVRHLERRLHRAERYGLNPYEANEIEQRFSRLESELRYASVDRHGRYGQYDGDRGHDQDRNWHQD